MKLCTTTGDFSSQFENDIDRIKELRLAGFKYADLSMYSGVDKIYMQDGWKDEVKTLKLKAEELGITFVQAHSPAYETLETLDPNENPEEKFRETIRSIEICAELGIPMTVSHAGVKRNSSKEETIELNKKYYKRLIPVMEKTGVSVLVENVGIKDNNGRYYLNSAERLVEFIEYFNHPLLHACWDIGHANVFGKQYDQIKTLGKHLYAIHYNDNDRVKDLHSLPFLHTLDNDDAMRGLIDAGFKGPFTFECTGLNQNLANSIEVARENEKTLYQTGKFLLNSYGIHEE